MFSKQILFKTIRQTILVCACFHIATMVIYTLVSGDYVTLNGFRVLGISLFIPGLDEGRINFIAGTGLLLAVFMSVYLYHRRKVQ